MCGMVVFSVGNCLCYPNPAIEPSLLHCRKILYHLSHQGSPRILEWVAYPSPGDLPDSGIELGSPALQADSLPAWLPGTRTLLQLIAIESVMLSNYLILCRPLLLPPLLFPSIRVFSNESVLHLNFLWPEHWTFSFSISPSNEYSGLISFRMDWFDLFAVQGTIKIGRASCRERV